MSFVWLVASAALFCIPELGTIRNNESERKRILQNGDENVLGIPSGAVFDRDMVSDFRNIPAETGEAEKGASKWDSRNALAHGTVERLFETFNSDPETQRIFDRVFPVARNPSIEYHMAK